ncbi:hypothetical protein ABH922_000583 [Rhodococcus sp. 27YEA15]|uniref:hypothetical protein n=1 Tax=Rhodococcus sp. 27YEA15 TaxID=3156259 RepID=UPI003C7B6317
MTDRYVVQDPTHSQVEITFDADTGVVEVRSGTSHAVLTRRLHAPFRDGIPIGTRTAADLHLTVGGNDVELSMGKGFLSRRSYSISVLGAGPALTFTPVDDATSEFTRDGVRIGALSKDENSDPRRTDAEWFGTPSGDELVIAYALAEAFDCGALHGAVALMESWLSGN